MSADREREVLNHLDPETWIDLGKSLVPELRERGSGGDWWGRCPVTNHGAGETLHLRRDLRWRCFGPGCDGGGPVQLVAGAKGVSAEEAVALIARRVGLG